MSLKPTTISEAGKVGKQKSAVGLLICFTVTLMLFAFAVAIWPTLYRYDHLNDLPVRINRITGMAEILYPSGWEAAGSAAESKPIALHVLTNDEIAKLQGKAEVSSTGSQITFSIYNASEWRIREVVVNVRVFVVGDDPLDRSVAKAVGHGPRAIRNRDTQSIGKLVIDRDFRMEGLADPLTTGLFDAYVWLDYTDRHVFDWSIKSAKGESF